MSEPSGLDILACPMRANGAHVRTIREYLVALARGAWLDIEFSGKRPFGSSSWKADLWVALYTADLIVLELDEDGYIDDMADSQVARADELILLALDALAITPNLTH